MCPQRAVGLVENNLSPACADKAPGQDEAPRAEGAFPGTGWGEHRSDPVQRVEFTAERRAADTIVFRYEYASGLRALGIIRHRDRLRDRDNGELGFAKPPRW